MKRKSSKKKRRIGKPVDTRHVVCQALVVIDEGPIRASAVKDCRKAMRDLEKARKKLEDFERLDQPAFTRWYHATFGAALSRNRELEENIEEMERLIEEIESTRDVHTISYHAAYEYVMDRRKHPERYERKRENPRHGGTKDEGQGEAEGPGDGTDAGDEEEFLFERFLEFAAQDPILVHLLGDRVVMGVLFEEYRAEFREHPGKQNRFANPPAAKAPPRQNRIKGLYRALVKRLHPDFRPRDDAHRDELWHRVQAAYAQEDLEGLETLTALCDIRIDNSFAAGSVSSILAVGRDQREQLAALKKRLRRTRKDLAWGFSRNPDIADSLEPLIRQDIESALGDAQRLYEDCKDTLERWSVPRQKKNPRREAVVGQTEFEF